MNAARKLLHRAAIAWIASLFVSFIWLYHGMGAIGPSWWVARGVLNTNAVPNDFAC